MAIVIKGHIGHIDFSTSVFTLTILNTSFDQKPLCKTQFIHEPSLVCSFSLHEPTMACYLHELLKQRDMFGPDLHILKTFLLSHYFSVVNSYGKSRQEIISNTSSVGSSVPNSWLLLDSYTLFARF